MKKRLLCFALAVAAAISAAATIAAAEKPTVQRAGNLILELNGGVTPRKLPKDEAVPLGFHASGSFSTVDGSHPPALEEGVFDIDRDVFVTVEGLPRCRLGQLQDRPPKVVEDVCGKAILGRGSVTVEVAFPDQAPFDAKGPLILFNGGERGGVVTLLGYTYVSVPAPTAVVTTAKLSRERKGGYGLRSVVQVPLIAGGSGSVVRANLQARRVYSYEGERRSLLSARCPDGHIGARGSFFFRDETRISGSLFRPC